VLAGVGGAQLALAWGLHGARADVPATRRGATMGRRLTPAVGLIVLGGLCALAYWAENAWQSWAAIHLERTRHSSAGVSALGPAAFASAAVCGRLAGHQLASRSSDRVLITGGALVGPAGTGLAAGAATVPVALIGIVVAGAGISVGRARRSGLDRDHDCLPGLRPGTGHRWRCRRLGGSQDRPRRGRLPLRAPRAHRGPRAAAATRRGRLRERRRARGWSDLVKLKRTSDSDHQPRSMRPQSIADAAPAKSALLALPWAPRATTRLPPGRRVAERS
jgi:hypothetical protein